MLLEMTDAIVARDNDLAGVGFFLAQDEFKQRRLTVTVAANETQTIAAVHLKTDVSEKLARKIRLGKLVDLNHDEIF
jgi:hypothetical protein